MQLTSTAFDNGGVIDKRYTADGEDTSPPLAWSSAPAATKSFALICDDPDAPSPRNPAPEPWVHWVIYNIPAEAATLPAGIPRESQPQAVPGARQGINSWPSDNLGYRGPAPPPGSGKHRYVFQLYALDAALSLQAGATKKQLLEAISDHILAEGQLIGTYER
jgi:Raf kinase inhibitor-like YbhB/YbcL family protein